MSAQDRRLGAAMLGAIFGLCSWFAFCLGSSIRACLIDRPQPPGLFLGETLTLFVVGLFTYFLIAGSPMFVGLVVGYFLPRRPFVILGLVSVIVGLGLGYFVTTDTCSGISL
jgi:hypothetical protein